MIERHFHDVFFNGKSLADFGVHLNGTDVFNSPEEDVQSVEVPGRNGDLHIFNERFKNVELKYHGWIAGDKWITNSEQTDFKINVRKLRNHLLSSRGYQRLEDTYHPDEFRLARFKSPFTTAAEHFLMLGEFDLTFDAKPQRFLKSGEKTITFTSSGTIKNPTSFASQPKLRVYGRGDLTIGDTIITVLPSNPYPYIDIDCEIQDAFFKSGTTTVNCNPYISLVDGDFFRIDPDIQTITLGRRITKVEIIPRWWIV